MTREEAIAILHNMEYDLSNQVGSTYCRKKYDAIRIAIKALEKEPCEDCISRQAVLDEVYVYCVDVEDIQALPPVTPTRKKGEWIKRNNDYFDWYECSECGYGSEGEMRYSREYDVRTNYCPKCGTQMLEVEE